MITGGNSGIGLATAAEFAAQGAKVVIFGRDQESLDNAIAEIGNESIAIKGDVTKGDDLERLFKETSEKFGSIDVLFVNAGVVSAAPVDEVDDENFDFISNINFKGAFFTVQKAVSKLNDGASIIFNSSIANRKGMPGMAVYSATKAAVRSLARSFTAELAGRGIRANVLSPGAIETPLWGKTGMSEEQIEEFSNDIGAQIPAGRFGTPGEMAKAALFLASDESSYVVGAELIADGGLTQL